MDFLLEGIKAITWQQVVMYVVGIVLIYLAIKKDLEPALLLPMGFGAILVNLPLSGVIDQIVGTDAEGKDIIAKGAIQIPPSEQPIVLLSERQSTGGYAKVGNVISVDIPKIGQTMTGSRLIFEKVSIEEAQQLLVEENLYLKGLETKIRDAQPTEYRVKVNQNIYRIAIQEIV